MKLVYRLGRIGLLIDYKKLKKINYNKFITKVISFSLLLIVLFVFLMTLTTKLPGKDKSLFGYKVLSISSSSMEPQIYTGSLVIINKNIDYNNLKVGDIITYRFPQDNNMLITHRVNEIFYKEGNTKFTTKGDNNKYIDNYYIRPENILGRYENINIKNFGYISEFLKTKKGLSFLVVVPIILIIGFYFTYSFVKLIKFDLHNKCKEDIFI